MLAFAAATGIGGDATGKRRQAALADPRIAALMDEMAAWPGEALSSHKSWNQGFQKLRFLADLGFTAQDGSLGIATDRILASRGEDGLPRLPFNISEARGGAGRGGLAWALCDAPTILYSLKRLAVNARLAGVAAKGPAAALAAAEPSIDAAVAALAALVRDNGWPCAVAKELGSWRGPGKKADPCPFATLGMLKLLLLDPGKWGAEIAVGVESLLGLWERSRTEHPYIFHMGTDFRKLKYPFVWYDILHVADALSRAPAAWKDPRFREMLAIIEDKEGPGGFVPESIYQACKGWDFGQKKAPSAWIGYAVSSLRERAPALRKR